MTPVVIRARIVPADRTPAPGSTPRPTAIPPKPFKPAWWCRTAHLQTLWHGIARRAPSIPYRREVLDLPDGDFVDVDWHDNGNGPLAVLLHGLCGSSRSVYILGLAATLSASGWGVAAINLRGAGGRPNRRPRTYHSGHTADLDHFLHLIEHRFPGRPIHAAGFSLGGNMLLKWLGEHPGSARLRSAAAVSVPYLLNEAARRMKSGASTLYQRHLLKGLKRATSARRRLLSGRLDFVAALAAGNFETFDDAVTAPVNGFSSARNYYALCSSRPYLRHITVPTLLVHARDDPFMTPEAIPLAEELGDAVELELYERGGHVGFVSGAVPWRPEYWLDARIRVHFAGC